MDPSLTIPVSIWERILQADDISATDVVSVSSTCKTLRESLLYNNSVWWSKFRQRWLPLSIELGKVGNCFDLYVQRHSAVQAAKEFLDRLPTQFMRERSKYLHYSAFETMEAFGNRYEYGSAVLIDELRCILSDTPDNSRLTHKYYATKAIRYLVQQSLTSRWQEWLNGPQLLETGAWLVAQWFAPNSFKDERLLTTELDRMAQDTLARISETNKHHPVLHCSPINHKGLRETLWSPVQAREVIEALNFVFSIRHGYRADHDESDTINNTLMHLVLAKKKGFPMSLCVLYQAVARRLGVYCELVFFPRHVLVKFVEHPGLPDSEKYTYVDVCNPCRLMREDQVWSTLVDPSFERNRRYPKVLTSVEVIMHMLHGIDSISEEYQVDSLTSCSVWELIVVLKPMQFAYLQQLSQAYSQLGINIGKIPDLLESVPEPGNDVPRAQKRRRIETACARMVSATYQTLPPPKLRSAHPHVKYAVGMIMHQKTYSNSTCVIIGWDPIYAAENSSGLHMVISAPPPEDKQQPFYSVLVNGLWNEYVAEENFVFEPNPVPILHSEEGRYFQRYAGPFYKMNADLLRDYPDDEAATIAYVQSAYGYRYSADG